MAVSVAIENIKMIRNQHLRQYTIYTVQDRIIENCFKSIKNESFLSLKINFSSGVHGTGRVFLEKFYQDK